MKRLLGKHDFLLITIIFALSIPFIVFQSHDHKPIVIVMREGETILKVSSPGRYDVKWKGKYLMKIEFDGERVRVVDSTCPLKLCEKMKWIRPGGTIVCVPNKVIVTFENVKRKYDTMTW